MHRHSRLNKPSKWRAATLLGLLVIAICSLLAVHPVLKGRTFSILTASPSSTKTYSTPDASQIARDRAIELKLVPAGKFPINKYDLVSAMPSDQTHLPVVKGSRSWRKVFPYVAYNQQRQPFLDLALRIHCCCADTGHPYSHLHKFSAHSSCASRRCTEQ